LPPLEVKDLLPPLPVGAEEREDPNEPPLELLLDPPELKVCPPPELKLCEPPEE
jgi:hypothetical protein